MKSLFNDITVVASLVLITSILLQQRSSSLGAGFGGETNFYRSKRGAEKLLYNSTIVAGIVLVLSIILSILSKK
jgi:protein translocase SecG subunit